MLSVKEQKELTFIQEETAHEWVGNFVQFYRQQILSFPKKTLVFDEEKQVMSQITEENIIIDGNMMYENINETEIFCKNVQVFFLVLYKIICSKPVNSLCDYFFSSLVY